MKRAALPAAVAMILTLSSASAQAMSIAATPSSQATIAPPSHAPLCTAADLSARGGREAGGFHGYASAVVQFANTSDPRCILRGTPSVAAFRADGTRLPLRFRVSHRATLQAVTLPGDSSWSASLTLSWSNWCHRKPGPLTVRVRIPSVGTLTDAFDGPPGYDFVPGCLDHHRPSRRRIPQLPIAGFALPL